MEAAARRGEGRIEPPEGLPLSRIGALVTMPPVTPRGPYENARSRRALPWWRLAMTILLLASVVSCEDDQIVVPTDPDAVAWTRITDPAVVKDATYSDWRGDSVLFHYVASNGRTWLGLMNEGGSNVTPFPQAGTMDEAYPRWITDDVVLYSSNDPGSFFGYDLRYKVLSTGEERRLGRQRRGVYPVGWNRRPSRSPSTRLGIDPIATRPDRVARRRTRR